MPSQSKTEDAHLITTVVPNCSAPSWQGSLFEVRRNGIFTGTKGVFNDFLEKFKDRNYAAKLALFYIFYSFTSPPNEKYYEALLLRDLVR